jgi:hypothetical protein
MEYQEYNQRCTLEGSPKTFSVKSMFSDEDKNKNRPNPTVRPVCSVCVYAVYGVYDCMIERVYEYMSV